MIQAMAIIGFFCVGIIVSIFGALKLDMVRVLGIGDARFGSIISVFVFTGFATFPAVGPLLELMGHRGVFIAGLLTGSIALFILVTMTRYPAALAAAAFLGIAGTLIVTVGNTLLTIVLFGGANESAALNLGHAFFGLGSVTTPFLTGLLLKRIGYHNTGRVNALLLLTPLPFALLSVFPDIPAEYSFASSVDVFFTPIILIGGVVLMTYVGLELSIGGWLTTYFTQQGFTNRTADYSLSAYWLCFTAARLLAIPVMSPGNSGWLVLTLSIAAAFLIYIMYCVHSRRGGLAAALFLGFMFGPIYPTTTGIALSHMTIAARDSAVASIAMMGTAGGVVVPAVLGIAAKKIGVRRSLIITVGVAAAMSAAAGMMIWVG